MGRHMREGSRTGHVGRPGALSAFGVTRTESVTDTCYHMGDVTGRMAPPRGTSRHEVALARVYGTRARTRAPRALRE